MTDAELVARVEALTGPCRETDAEIYLALYLPDWRKGSPWKKTNGWFKPGCAIDAMAFFFHDGLGWNHKTAPTYTASLDAAMTLYIKTPDRVPSNPRLAAAEALRQRS